ncbi:hypothetical protein PF010_g24469 [Phytophthora fragariae]|uniref:Uncharacterized protein n=1 Tax=Phytophthora fragariae TaxID=53985 RepID=A0A6A4C192_9STRA|nr:hypothetical protein PF009_g25067 [Phytophthora fragariae]KAE8978392.1 hypothetical protein PF011_g23259 [Phytophthora fragariae]KAE9074999.1 hypothetical protein PF010_g24469 [Phytophthora fragariae]KAE9078723.1 hypothetical protein PF007_g23730 [Phytophthora fragariae]KAE9281863.1 hypothetical protein PF001_g23587 [Phytophthora fragariae]
MDRTRCTSTPKAASWSIYAKSVRFVHVLTQFLSVYNTLSLSST